MRGWVQRCGVSVVLVAAMNLSAQEACKATPVSGFGGLTVSAKGVSCDVANSVATGLLRGHKPAGWNCRSTFSQGRQERQTCTKDGAEVYLSYRVS